MSVIRLVRVDFESPIVEKDKDAGYVLFNYTHAGKQYAGSVEVVPTGDKGEQRVKVLIQIAGMPSYIERMMLDKLEKKLVQEFGAPMVAPARRGAGKAADDDAAGTDKASDPEDAADGDGAQGDEAAGKGDSDRSRRRSENR
jgi:hypothetical protein